MGRRRDGWSSMPPIKPHQYMVLLQMDSRKVSGVDATVYVHMRTKQLVYTGKGLGQCENEQSGNSCRS